MTRILILGGDYDIHTPMVKWGLEKLGYSGVTIQSWYDFPSKTSSSLHLTGQGDISVDLSSNFRNVSFDTVWYRRPGSPVAHSDVHETDKSFVESESKDYLDNVLRFLGNNSTLWVNHPDAARLARNKAVQLSTAHKVGLVIPDTIFTNNPQDVREFFYSHEKSVIYKPFRPAEWIAKGGSADKMFILPTTPLNESMIQDYGAIGSCPGIYQHRVEIKFEVRATIMGGAVIACKILSQEKSAVIDWRHDLSRGLIRIEPYTLPDKVRELCLQVCKDLGLSTGCFDFIVDPNEDHIFIEVNEAGQFLWKEEIAPELPLLDTFCRFLAREENGSNRQPVRLSEYLTSEIYRADQDNMARQYRDNKKLLSKWRRYVE